MMRVCVRILTILLVMTLTPISGYSRVADNKGNPGEMPVAEMSVVELSPAQKELITTILMPLIVHDHVGTGEKRAAVRIDDFQDSDLIWLLGWHLNQRLEANVQFPRGAIGNRTYEPGERERLVNKADALEQLGDMYGMSLSDERLLEEDDTFLLEGDKIGVIGSSGELTEYDLSITDAELRNGNLIVNGTYKIRYDERRKYPEGTLAAVFASDKESPLGYTFQCVTFDGEEFCKDIYQYFGDWSVAEAKDAIDRGDYYEMTASIYAKQVEGSYNEVPVVRDVIIRIRKDATACWVHDRDNPFSLDDYANGGREGTPWTFHSARMLDVTHDDEGYIIAFADGQAG